jgi:hypothetical protein
MDATTATVRAVPIFGPMVTITIWPAAFAAIGGTLPTESKAEARPDGERGCLIA